MVGPRALTLTSGPRGSAVPRNEKRHVVALARVEQVASITIPHLNRFSLALFVLARAANLEAGVPDVLRDSRA